MEFADHSRGRNKTRSHKQQRRLDARYARHVEGKMRSFSSLFLEPPVFSLNLGSVGRALREQVFRQRRIIKRQDLRGEITRVFCAVFAERHTRNWNAARHLYGCKQRIEAIER